MCPRPVPVPAAVLLVAPPRSLRLDGQPPMVELTVRTTRSESHPTRRVACCPGVVADEVDAVMDGSVSAIWMAGRDRLEAALGAPPVAVESAISGVAADHDVRFRCFTGSSAGIPRKLDVFAEVREGPPLTTPGRHTRA